MSGRIELLLLPGMTCDAAFWRAQIRDLSDIAVPRVMTFGLLDRFEAMADKVLAEAPEQFALAGHSMGGRVAQAIYRKAPDRVLRLALLATDYRGHVSEEARVAEETRRESMLAKAKAQGMEGFARDWVKVVVAPRNLRNTEVVEEIVAMIARQPLEVLAAQTLAGLRRPDCADVLARVTCPTLVLSGDADTLRPVAVHEEMAARIPRSRLVVVADAGHMVAMEQPDAVTHALRDWLLE